MTPTSPFFIIAALAAVCNLIGAALSFRLFWQNGLDYHAVLVTKIDQPRTMVAWHSFFSEGVRFTIQLASLSTLVASFLIDSDVFNAAVSGILPLVVWSSCVTIYSSFALLTNSFVGLKMRWFVREAIIMDPDPDDVAALDAPLDDPTAETSSEESARFIGNKARNIRRDN